MKSEIKYTIYGVLIIVLLGPVGYLAERYLKKNEEIIYYRLMVPYENLRIEIIYYGCKRPRFRALLAKIPDINKTDKDGDSILHQLSRSQAYTKGCISEIARNYSVMVNTKDRHGQTAVMTAFNRANFKAARELIRLGADIAGVDPEMKRIYDYNMDMGL